MIGWVPTITIPPRLIPQSLTLRDDMGGAFKKHRRVRERDVARFLFDFERDNKEEMEDALYFFRLHQGDTVFWFDGGQFGRMSSKQPFGIGDGTRTQWLLPNRNIIKPTLIVYEDGNIQGGWTLVESTGSLTFDAAPGADVVLEAEYWMEFPVVIAHEGEAMFEIADQFKSYSESGIILEETPQV